MLLLKRNAPTLWSAMLTIALATASLPLLSQSTLTESGLEASYKLETDRYEKAFDAFEQSGGRNQPFRHDLTPLAKQLVASMREGPSLLERQTAAVLVPMLRDYEIILPVAIYEQVEGTVPPDSQLWAKHPDAIGEESEALPPEVARQFLLQLRAKNPNEHVQATVSLALVHLAERERDPVQYERAYRDLAAKFANDKSLRFEIKRLDPRNKTAVGKKAAAFELPALDSGTKGEVSSQALSGKYYILDFWASWCGPCLGERASLQRAFEKFGQKNFTIVSISLDKTPEDAKHYQQKRWSMPWVNAFLPGGQESQTARDYDVDWMGLPVMLLISPDGTILATRDELGRLSLQTTLEDYLGGNR